MIVTPGAKIRENFGKSKRPRAWWDQLYQFVIENFTVFGYSGSDKR